MTQHTPGPWKMRAAIRPDEFEVRNEKSSGGFAPIAKIRGDKRSTMEQAAANARLIAAAPDLLEALQAMLTTWEHGSVDVYPIAKTRSAIAKATGQA